MTKTNNNAGPVDEPLKTVVNILLKYRTTRKWQERPWWTSLKEEDTDLHAFRPPRLTAVSEEDRALYKRAILEIEKVAVRIGLFSTSNFDRIYSILDDMEHGLRAYVGIASGFKGASWLFSNLRRWKKIRTHKTPSELLYIELRTRLHIADQRDPDKRTKPVHKPAEHYPTTGHPVAADKEFICGTNIGSILFGPQFPPKCRSNDAKVRIKLRFPQLMKCSRGCDLLLLEMLAYPQESVMRLTGFDARILDERRFTCRTAAGLNKELIPVKLDPNLTKHLTRNNPNG